MNDSDKAIQILTTEVIKTVKHLCRRLHYDKTYLGVFSSVNTNGYTVKYNGTDINIKTTATNLFKVNDHVKFCIPCGNKRKAFIVADLDLISKNN